MSDAVVKSAFGTGAQPLSSALLGVASLAWRDAPRASAKGAVMPDPATFGSYQGLQPKVALLSDGQTVNLLSAFAFRTSDGVDWPVPVGVTLQGVSVPRVMWSLIGGPFEGRYRDASILHGYYSDLQSRAWRVTHHMFYAAARVSLVPEFQAKLMFYAVYRFGPRWPVGSEGVDRDAAQAPRPPTDSDGPTILADAQAIWAHDLNLAEIEALADARDTQRASAARQGPAADLAMDVAVDPLPRARLLVVVGGSGSADDLEPVAIEVAKLPDEVLARFESRLIRVIACRGGVTDFETDLRGVTPRGWEGTGRTWDNVPGTYFDDRKRVVIATVDDGTGARIVPTRASGLHGSACLVVHESLHGYDYSGGHAVIHTAEFGTARQADLAKLGAYELQAGGPGLEESFAESGARFQVEAASLHADWPGLFGYWEAGPLTAVDAAALVAPAAALRAPMLPLQDAPIGTARLNADGTIHLDLRAEGPGGGVGHAAFAIAPTDAVHPAVMAHLFPPGPDGAPADLGKAFAPDAEIAFRPMPAHVPAAIP